MLLKTKFRITILFAVLIVELVGSIEYLKYFNIMEDFHLQYSAAQLSREIYDINFVTYEYLKESTPQSIRQWKSQYTNLNTSLSRIKTSLSVGQNIIEDMEHNLETLGSLFMKLEDYDKISLSKPEELREEINRGGAAQLLDCSRALDAKSVQLAEVILTSFRASHKQRLFGMISMFIMLAVSSVLVLVSFDRSIFPRLEKLNKAFLRTTGGNFDHQIRSSNDDELGEIYRSFNETTARLAEITVSCEALEKEVKKKELILVTLKQVLAALDQSHDAVFMYNMDSKAIFYANTGAERIFGYTRETLVSKKITDLVKENRGKEEGELFTPLSVKASYTTIEMEFVRKNGTAVFLEYSSRLIEDPDKKEYILIIARDISARKAAGKELLQLKDELEGKVKMRTRELQIRVDEAEQLNRAMINLSEDLLDNQRQLEVTLKMLAESNKELEGFSYSVSHDLRAPLRHMSGFVDLIQKHIGDSLDDKSKHYLEVIKSSSATMGQLIDDLLQYSRTGRGRTEVKKRIVNNEELVHDVIVELAAYEDGQPIEWLIGNLPQVTSDSTLMRIVWMNLLGNAVKFTSKKDKARIEVGSYSGKRKNDEVVFYVKDNGAGFDPKFKDKLFGVFQRLHRESEFPGTGIGLAMVKRILNWHNGEIWAEGEVGAGAAFYFYIPEDI